MSNEFDANLDLFVQAALGKKAQGVVVLDVRELTSIAEVFIICSGTSNRQVSAIADHIQRFLKEHSTQAVECRRQERGPMGLDGLRTCDHSRLL